MKNIDIRKIINILLCFIIPFLVCIIFASFPTLKMEISTSGTNFSFHALRIKGLWWSIENGIFPHHINDLANDFMGDADPIGYPYLFLYIPAYLLRFLPYTYCYNIYIIIINIATFIIMYISSYYIYKDKKAAIVSSITFTLFYYRLYDVYDFCRMGEYTGLMFYPLAISGLYNIFLDDKKKWWFLTIAMCGALGAHIITFFYLLLMVIVLSIVLYIISLIIKKEPLRILELIKAGIFSILLTLWYIVPFLEYYFEGVLNFSDMGAGSVSSTTVTFLMPGDINVGSHYENIDNRILGFLHPPTNMSFGDYIENCLIIVFIVLIILILISKYLKNKDIKLVTKENMDNNMLHFILAVLFFLIYLYYHKASVVGWPFQNNGLELISEIYAKQQFSFRELGRGGVFLSLSVGYIFTKLFYLISNKFKSTIVKKVLVNIPIYLILFITILSTATYIESKLDGRNRQDEISDSSLSDYQFKDGGSSVEYEDMSVGDTGVLLDGEKTEYYTSKYHINNYRRGYLSINFDYEYVATNSNIKNEVVGLKKNAYTGYNFYIDNNKNDFARLPSGRPEIAISGDKGHVSFKFENNIRWHIAFVISFITFMVLLIKRLYKEVKSILYLIKEKREEEHE